MSDTILEMQHITKTFSGNKALDDVNLSVKKGEILSLCGENGAGKSTLMNILSGVYPHNSYEGEIYFNGINSQYKNVNDSKDDGIVIIHQELQLIPQLSIGENILLGNEVQKNGIINWNETFEIARTLMKLVGLKENPHTLIQDIGMGKRQLVEIAKALSKNVKLLILDEPTAALNDDESKHLLELMGYFKEQGLTQIMISHKLNEVMAVSDRVTILRDGQVIESFPNDEVLTEDRIIKGMVGRELSNRYSDVPLKVGKKYFEVKNWNVHHPLTNKKILNNINFHINEGEIVGIAGLVGAGRTELAMSLFGKSYGSNISGEIQKNGEKLVLNNAGEAIKHGIAYLSEDRKENGLVLKQDIKNNISLASLDKVSNRNVLDEELEYEKANYYIDALNIKTHSIDQNVSELSGGNQQKVALAKWLLSDPEVLFLDEATRGIDVGAKNEIYKIIYDIAKSGKSVLMISSELPELLGMCERIYTMAEGVITNEFTKSEFDQEKLMSNMTTA